MAGKATHLIDGYIRGEIKNLGETGVAFGIPMNEKYRKDGEMVETTTWYNIKAFGKAAELIKEYCSPGDFVQLQCKFEVNEDESGQKWPSFVVRPHFDGFTFGPKLKSDDEAPF